MTTIAPIVLKGRVVSTLPEELRTDGKRWVCIRCDSDADAWWIPAERLMVGESVTITITPDDPEYGSTVLKDIQANAEEK